MLFQSGSSLCPPPDGKVGIRVAEKLGFSDLRSTSFNPRTILFSLLHLLAMQLICDGQCTNWFTLHFTIYSIQVMANLSTEDCQTMWTIIFFISSQCSSFVMGNDDWLSHLSDEIQPKCEKSPPKSSRNEKFIFILPSTSDDWPSDPSNKSGLKCKKRPPKSSKNEMLSFGLCSTSDDQPSDLSDES